MMETIEIQRGGELEYLLNNLPNKKKTVRFSQEEIRAALASEENAAKAAVAIQRLAASKSNAGAGSMSARLGKVHIKLHKLVRSAALSVFFLGLATMEPSGITLMAGAGKGVEFLITFSELVSKMSKTEVLLYDIIAGIEAQNILPSINPDKRRGTKQDILDVIRERKNGIPRDFQKALDDLLGKEAIKSEPGIADDDPVYRIIL